MRSAARLNTRKFLKPASFALFRAFDRLGVHILPKHYYTPIPDYAWLAAHRDAWTQRASLAGVAWDLEQQLVWLASTCQPYYPEVAGLSIYQEITRSQAGPGFGPIESQVLHCFVRAFKPKRIIEIGSGVSTLAMLHAAALNQQQAAPPTEITCIEPYPSDVLKHLHGIRRIQQPAQLVDAELFSQLQAGDLLFIDSSHAVKTGSDVPHIYLNIIPKLVPGVFVHIHDVYLPYLYPRDVLSSYFGWQETAMLLALLVNNAQLEVRACLSALSYDRTAQVRQVLPDYQPQASIEGLRAPGARGDFPSSMWLQVR
ncbi:MAG TPA: class I SAM-dependent methyltransferase [Thermomicrobiaceae bacterium]|nr:class I SAM-dependent methyltransferase [Thermomicrobiaceae bacterium]